MKGGKSYSNKQNKPAFFGFLDRIKALPVHPFLFAAFPVLDLLGHNIEEIRSTVAIRALIFCLVLCTALLLSFWMLFKDWDTAAAGTSGTLILFFTYGNFYNFLKGVNLFGASFARHRILAPVWLFGLVIFIWWLRRKKRKFRNVQVYLNLVAAIALLTPLFQIGLYGFRTQAATTGEGLRRPGSASLHLPVGRPAPDVYYFILDAYTRDDQLLGEYGLDNTLFLEQLNDLGFFVATCSQSNYAQTQLSLGSSLNLNYLETLSDQFTAKNRTRTGIQALIRYSVVRQTFENLGYKTVAFETGFKTTEWDDANVYLSPSSARGKLQIGAGLNGFELTLLKNSAGLLLTDATIKLPGFLQADFDNPNRVHRDLILYDLDQLANLPALPGPKFVFAHLVIPHPPYVFGPDGEFIDYEQEAKTGYRNQVIYLNKRLIPLLKTILDDSETQPIIVIQGDHGGVESPPPSRMTILNAYYLPDYGTRLVYKSITPVNTFRMIFDQYFGGQYEFLEDTSYFSSYAKPFNYTIIPNTRAGCK